MNIIIKNLDKFSLKSIDEELETSKWCEEVEGSETPETVTVKVSNFCIFKVYDDEILLDFAGNKCFIHQDDFGEITII